MESSKRIHVFVIPVTVFLVTAFLVSCSAQPVVLKKEAKAGSRSTKVQEPPAYLIQPGDQLGIMFFFNPELNATVSVRPDGKISLQLVDDVQAAGLEPSQLDMALTQMYARELKEPEITVIVKSFTGQRVYVGGEVVNPRLVDLTAGMTTLQAIIDAGGFKETAKPEAVLVIRRGPDRRPIPLQVDLKQVIDGEALPEDFQLQPYDIVHVPKTWIAEANKFVNQYIERLLLYKGVSLGFAPLRTN